MAKDAPNKLAWKGSAAKKILQKALHDGKIPAQQKWAPWKCTIFDPNFNRNASETSKVLRLPATIMLTLIA
jgi:hypothetical protein